MGISAMFRGEYERVQSYLYVSDVILMIGHEAA
jgi:hypothetical protein